MDHFNMRDVVNNLELPRVKHALRNGTYLQDPIFPFPQRALLAANVCSGSNTLNKITHGSHSVIFALEHLDKPGFDEGIEGSERSLSYRNLAFNAPKICCKLLLDA